MTRSLSVDQAIINKLVNIVLKNLHDENFGVEWLAEEAGMSRVTVHRKIKSIKGQNVSQFIREIRLQKAIKMLEDNEGNVAEIAFKVGFGSPTYFIKCFHDYYGFPPGEARNMKSSEPGDDQAIENWKSGDYKELNFKPDIKSILKRNKYKNILLASLAILSLFLIINFLFTPLEPQEKSIAVVPFRNDSPDTTNLYFINNVTDRIASNLQKIKELRVISGISVEKYRYNKTKSASEIARELGVNFIIEGSGQKYGNSLSIVVTLIKARGKEKRLWNKPYDLEIEKVEDYIVLESEVAQKIADELEAVISPEERQLIEIIPTANLTADNFYQRGREAYSIYWKDNDKSSLKEAEYYYLKALKYDPDFAQAYAGLSRIYGINDYYNTYYSKNYLDSVLILCNKALFYNDKVEEAYISRAWYYTNIGQFGKATDDLNKAIEINPNSWEAYYFNMPIDDIVKRIENLYKTASLNPGAELPTFLKKLAYELGWLSGFPDLARNYLQQALILDGDSASYYRGLAGIERSQGNSIKNIDFLLKSYEIDSSDYDNILQIGTQYSWLGQYKEALDYTKLYLDKQQNPIVTGIRRDEHRIAYTYWMNENRTEGENYFKKQIEDCLNEIEMGRIRAKELYPYYDLAAIYAFLGEKDKAFDYLGRFSQKKEIYQGIVTWIKTDPFFAGIRNESEFQQIVRDLEAKYQAVHERVGKWLEDNRLL